MRAIEMSGEDLKEILKHMPKKLRDKLMAAVKPDSGIGYLRDFVEQYEDDDMRDHIIAHTLSNVFRKVIATSRELIDERNKDDKPGLSTIEMGVLVIECLKNEAENIQKALDEHQKDCEHGRDCGAKHKH